MSVICSMFHVFTCNIVSVLICGWRLMTHVLNLGVHNMGTLRRVFLTNDEAEAETLQNQIQDIRSALKSMETRILSRQQDQLDELQQNQNQELRSALKSIKRKILRRQQDKLDEQDRGNDFIYQYLNEQRRQLKETGDTVFTGKQSELIKFQCHDQSLNKRTLL